MSVQVGDGVIRSSVVIDGVIRVLAVASTIRPAKSLAALRGRG